MPFFCLDVTRQYMKLISRIGSALIVVAVFGYLAYTIYSSDHLSGRQFRIVLLIASVMTGIFGKTAAAVITAGIGLAAGIFLVADKEDDNDSDKIIPTRHL